MSNFKSAAKRKRELAKLDKRQAKEKKRALRRAERPGSEAGTPVQALTTIAQSTPASPRAVHGAPAASKPMTLAEVVERWKNTKVAKPPRR